MSVQRDQARLLIYSHDSFGLGHLRRCRAIAHSLVDHRRDLSVLILSGSPIIGNFGFRTRVDFVRVPGVIKLRHGDYTSLSLDMGLEEILALRASIIHHTAEMFAPDIFLVDKEPLGLRGEVRDTLTMLKTRGVPLVLGLREVMDDPVALSEEWRRKNAVSALRDLYDHIWVYGPQPFYDPLAGVDVPATVRDKMTFTGYLRRSVSQGVGVPVSDFEGFPDNEPYILVTTGGGGDGARLIDWVLRAYEHNPRIPHNALLVLGPFMRTNLQGEFLERTANLERVRAITFDAHIEGLMAGSIGVVGMGGYNTFCEILSFDKPAVIVPRTVPRMEQHIRATRAQELGLMQMIPDDGPHDPAIMADALCALPSQPRPSEMRLSGLLDGLSVINGMVDDWLNKRRKPAAPELSLVQREG